MRLKTFTAKSLPEAMARVRERLGDDAVILQQQETDDGGVRITAALESDPGPAGAFAGADGMDAFSELTEALDYHRVPNGLVDRLVAAAGGIEAETPELSLAGGLDAVMSFGAPPAAATRKPLLLMGPPGGGKTATAAKLAAHARMRGAEATLITLDVGKAGGLAQIGAFAEALGAELREARDADSLGAAVAGAAADRLVLIDTLGTSAYDDDGLREIGEWMQAAGAEGVLVLPAGGDPVESAEAALAYAGAGARQMIATKLDSTRRLGGVLSAAHTAQLTLMGAGVAATIGGGLRAINPVQLARLILPEPAPDDADGESPARPGAADAGADDPQGDGPNRTQGAPA